MRKNWMLGVAVAGMLGASGMLGISVARAQVPEAERVRVASSRASAPLVPEVSALDLSGRSWNLRSLRGRPVILSLCATWCPASHEQMADLERLQQKFGARGLLILAVSTENAGELASYVRSSGLKVPLLTDSGRAVSNALGTGAFPTTYFIGRDSRILARTVGAGPGVARLFAALTEAELAQTSASPAHRRQFSGERLAPPRSGSRPRSSARPAISRARRNGTSGNKRAAKAGAKDDGVVLLSNSGRRVIR